MEQIESAKFQTSKGTEFLRRLIDSGSGLVVAMNGPAKQPIRSVKLTYVNDYAGASISCRDIKAGGVSKMVESIKEGNDMIHARIGGNKFFRMELVLEFIDIIRQVCGYRGITKVGGIYDLMDLYAVERKASLTDLGFMVSVDGEQIKDCCAFSTSECAAYAYRKDDSGNIVVIRSHIDGIADTVEHKGILEIRVDDEVVFKGGE